MVSKLIFISIKLNKYQSLVSNNYKLVIILINEKPLKIKNQGILKNKSK